jgi:hypothetical protein
MAQTTIQISHLTALASGLATTDEILVSDAGVTKRMDISVLEIAATQITASGTLPALSGVNLTALVAGNITSGGTFLAQNGSALTALNGTQITSGTVPVAQLGSSGSRSSSTFLNGANAWAAAGGDFSNGGDAGALILGTNDSNSLTLETDNTARITIESGGNVGIGITDPERLLHLSKGDISVTSRSSSLLVLEDNDDVCLQFLTPATNTAEIMFGDPGDVTAGRIKYNHNDNILKIGTSGSDKLEIAAAGDVTVKTGNLVIATAGKGIDFSINTDAGAASGITTDSELLDYYEEGTFTPFLQDGSGSASESQTHSLQSGRYTKIGNRCFFTIALNVNALGDLTTGQQAGVGGLPFTSANVTSHRTGVSLGQYHSMSLGTSGYGLQAYIEVNATHMNLFINNVTTGAAGLLISAFTSAGYIEIAGQYEV